jgi:hypothetical protein
MIDFFPGYTFPFGIPCLLAWFLIEHINFSHVLDGFHLRVRSFLFVSSLVNLFSFVRPLEHWFRKILASSLSFFSPGFFLTIVKGVFISLSSLREMKIPPRPSELRLLIELSSSACTPFSHAFVSL